MAATVAGMRAWALRDVGVSEASITAALERLEAVRHLIVEADED